MESILGRRCYDQEVWEFSAREFAANIVLNMRIFMIAKLLSLVVEFHVIC